MLRNLACGLQLESSAVQSHLQHKLTTGRAARIALVSAVHASYSITGSLYGDCRANFGMNAVVRIGGLTSVLSCSNQTPRYFVGDSSLPVSSHSRLRGCRLVTTVVSLKPQKWCWTLPF
ncbi:uncharacterized protein IUM83_11566 [Phytophthora cinnamomi]|uniref:uncharacterized protein n=1 Tax=Phytophthora cinnamomi TaxID=4785 RepID=UPI003559A3DC|nr:hypothetical protein IUM83_11566 [Phytophthora cinnamomi]